MTNNDIINLQLSNLISTQTAVAEAYNTVDPQLMAMYRTYQKKSEGQPEGVKDLCAQNLGYKLIEFMGEK